MIASSSVAGRQSEQQGVEEEEEEEEGEEEEEEEEEGVREKRAINSSGSRLPLCPLLSSTALRRWHVS